MTPTYRHRTLGCTTTKPPCRPLPGRNWVATGATRLRSRPLRNWPHPPRPPTTDRDLGELDWLVCSLSIISIITKTVYTGNPLTSPDLSWSGLQTSLRVYVANDKWYNIQRKCSTKILRVNREILYGLLVCVLEILPTLTWSLSLPPYLWVFHIAVQQMTSRQVRRRDWRTSGRSRLRSSR